MENRNEVWITFEEVPGYVYTSVYYTEADAVDHVRKRRVSILGTEMEGRDISYKKYVILGE